MKTAENAILEAHISAEADEKLQEEVKNENMKLLKYISATLIGVLFVVTQIAIINEETPDFIMFVVTNMILDAGVFIITMCKTEISPKMEKVLILAVETIIYVFGILIGTIMCEPDSKMVTFAGLIVFIPGLFIEKPSTKITLSTIALAIFAAIDIWYKPFSVATGDIADAFIFGVIGMVSGTMLMKTRIGNIRGKFFEKEYIEMLEEHTDELNDKFVFSIGDMIGSRDQSTGGHVKRTSQVVSILMDEIRREDDTVIDEEESERIVKAAPLHDVGKVAVDDAILRKEGKYTNEEFNMMKSHTVSGAKIISNLFDEYDDREMARVAENMAHYHHERYDGSGYPEGLKGEDIPIEARIMAIADVYDALVSKRCYKDAMSCTKAFSIIEDGMGTQFDPALDKYFRACRPRLEEYYSSVAPAVV